MILINCPIVISLVFFGFLHLLISVMCSKVLVNSCETFSKFSLRAQALVEGGGGGGGGGEEGGGV